VIYFLNKVDKRSAKTTAQDERESANMVAGGEIIGTRESARFKECKTPARGEMARGTRLADWGQIPAKPQT